MALLPEDQARRDRREAQRVLAARSAARHEPNVSSDMVDYMIKYMRYLDREENDEPDHRQHGYTMSPGGALRAKKIAAEYLPKQEG